MPKTFFGQFAGMQYFRLFRILPDHIDRNKPPGYSVLPRPTVYDWLYNAVTLRHIWASPNFVWCVIALLMYFVFPYDLSPTSAAASGVLSWAFFAERLPLWYSVTFGYYAFWHVTLYGLGWAERPMIAARKYNWDKVAHNVWHSSWGIVIWVGFENVFAFLWATGRLSYLSDADALGSVSGFVRFAVGLIAIPLWRDVHFYFAHRLLHYKPLFALVHSLHHRNTDIEPFSGLCMHPVEHLYYYSCILPSLVVLASPFHFLWNGVHLLISPAAGHSGWEDHWQADMFHYMHHRYFECNYAGFGSAAIDVLFGTFTEKFKEAPPAQPRTDAKSTLRSVPAGLDVLYISLSAACVAAWVQAVNAGAAEPIAMATSFMAGFGPVIIACVYAVFVFGAGSLLEPYSKQPAWQNLVHVALGTLCCSVPITAACYLAF